MKDQGRQDCEGDCRSWRIAICSSDAAKHDSVTLLFWNGHRLSEL